VREKEKTEGERKGGKGERVGRRFPDGSLDLFYLLPCQSPSSPLPSLYPPLPPLPMSSCPFISQLLPLLIL
jgi:hypothetical protein